MANLTIKQNHPARKDITDLGDYFESVGAAVSAVQDLLADHALKIELDTWRGDEGRFTCRVLPVGSGCFTCSTCAEKQDTEAFDNVIVFSYYKLRDGKWEIITYMS